MDNETITITIKIPKVFFDDHRNRDLIRDHETSTITKTLSKHYIVTLTTRDAAELIDDAAHYSTPDQFEFDLQYLVSSARATLGAIRKHCTYEQVIEWLTTNGYNTTARYLRCW